MIGFYLHSLCFLWKLDRIINSFGLKIFDFTNWWQLVQFRILYNPNTPHTFTVNEESNEYLRIMVDIFGSRLLKIAFLSKLNEVVELYITSDLVTSVIQLLVQERYFQSHILLRLKIQNKMVYLSMLSIPSRYHLPATLQADQ